MLGTIIIVSMDCVLLKNLIIKFSANYSF